MDNGEEVQLYVYDITQGLARSLSPMLLGRQIDGVWHTGVVVFGQEFTWGNGGVLACPPGGTILGEPTEKIVLGRTQLSVDIFLDYIHELSQTTYRPECYDLFNQNCCHFSDEIAQFLTGQKIPAHITNLPQEVLQTPFGAMIKPYIDSMFGNVRSSSVSPNPAASSGAFSAPVTSHSSAVPLSAASSQPAAESVPPIEPPQRASYSNPEVISEYRQQVEYLHGLLQPVDKELVNEVSEYLLVTGEHDWSLGPAHLRVLCDLIRDTDLRIAARRLLAELLQSSLLCEDFIAVCIHQAGSDFVNLVSCMESLPSELQNAVTKCICNSVSTKAGAEWFVGIRHQESSASPLIAIICHHCLLSEDRETRLTGSRVISNIISLLQKLPADVAFDLGVTLIEACGRADCESAEYVWYSFCVCVQSNPQLAELVTAMGLDISEHEKKFPVICKYTSAIHHHFDSHS